MDRVRFETHPDRYNHWNLEFDGNFARLHMDVAEDGGLDEGYKLKLNSYDLGVDIELADAIERIRFEHPEVQAVLVTSALDRVFCAGANIFMLGSSSHAFKVNFCKFTNETRLAIEDASENSGLKFLAALNGICAGGGYELALACDEIYLVDDGNSAVSLPEVPLLGVLPGTGGLTRVVDKRRVRRDRADFFSTLVEGIKGKRAVDWGLVDGLYPMSRYEEVINERLKVLAAQSDRPGQTAGIALEPLHPTRDGDDTTYGFVTVNIDRARRNATLTIRAPEGDEPSTPADMQRAGSNFWALKVFRELNDALLDLRLNEPEIGTLLIHTEGSSKNVLAVDRTLHDNAGHWLVREIIHYIKRILKRLDLTAKSIIALIEPGSCFAGTLFELALAADRSYMMDDPDNPPAIQLSPMNGGPYKMGNGLTRLETRFLTENNKVSELMERAGPFDPVEAEKTGLVTFAPDDIDWEDDVRMSIEERQSLSPDALTGMEANLRFAGPETMETKIFGRLTAWQNWIFQRPNAVGDRGALKVYGQAGQRPEFDWRRT
jgi:benzoyl-CoA-dihydrodiol lyase